MWHAAIRTNLHCVAPHLSCHQIMTYQTNIIVSRPIFSALLNALGFDRRNWACIDVLAVISTTAFSLVTPACRGVVVNDEWHYLQISPCLVIPVSNTVIEGGFGQWSWEYYASACYVWHLIDKCGISFKTTFWWKMMEVQCDTVLVHATCQDFRSVSCDSFCFLFPCYLWEWLRANTDFFQFNFTRSY